MCAPTTAALGEWIDQLPIANTVEAARALQKATSETAQLKVDPVQRLDLLETLRPTVHYICSRLDSHLRHRANDARESAHFAIRLQTNLAVGYKAVIRDALQDDQSDLLPIACHRALSDYSRVLLRSLQHYIEPPKSFWGECHQILHLAEEGELADKTVEDGENFSTSALSVTGAYLRSALLAMARPNQLRPAHLNALFNALESWLDHVTCTGKLDDAQFAIDLDSAAAPAYTDIARFDDDANPRGIVTEVLVYEIEAYLNEITTSIEIPDFVDPLLLSHVALAWDTSKKRSFRRLPTRGTLKTCLGMRATHYHLSGGVDFANQIGKADMLMKKEINPFVGDENPKASDDVWDRAPDMGRSRIPENPNIENPERLVLDHVQNSSNTAEIKNYTTEIVNTSPGGYCIRWSDPLPDNLLAGDILGIREQQNARWCVAVIRWIKNDGDGVLSGVELLAPRAIAVAVRGVKTRRNHADFSRGLLLPAIEAINQPAMLITPRLAFQESQKVHISRQGIQTTAQLMRGVLSTESFNQFTFRMLDGYLENAHIDMNMERLQELLGDDSDAPA